MFNLKCQRRIKHMYRSLNFISKAQDSLFMKSLSPEQQAEDKVAFDEALVHMRSFMGPDAEYIMMLKQKMIDRGTGTADSVKEIVTLLTMLLRGSPEDQAQIAAEVENHHEEMNELLDNELSVLDKESGE